MRLQPTDQLRIDVGAGVAFLLGAVSFIEFQVVGKLFVTDLALAVICIFELLKRARRLERPMIGRLLCLGGLWFASQVITDVIRHSVPSDYMRGWAKIIFFLLDLSALYLLARSKERVLCFAAGLGLGQLLSYLLSPTPEALEDPWKWGLAWPISLFVVLVAGLFFERRQRFAAATLLGAISLANFYFNFRSLGFICFETFSFVTFLSYRPKRLSKRPIVYAAAAMLLGGVVFQNAYKYAASAGMLGRPALDKYQQQSEGDLGLLLGGRSESLASLQAIAESPLIGHGSWARDSRYGALLQQTLAVHGYASSRVADDLIPTHSHVLGAWVEAGILGAVFWVYLFSLTLKGLYGAVANPDSLRVLTCYFALMLAWDIPFSPFGAQQRFLTALYLLVVIRSLSQNVRVRKKSLRKRGASQKLVSGSFVPPAGALSPL